MPLGSYISYKIKGFNKDEIVIYALENFGHLINFFKFFLSDVFLMGIPKVLWRASGFFHKLIFNIKNRGFLTIKYFLNSFQCSEINFSSEFIANTFTLSIAQDWYQRIYFNGPLEHGKIWMKVYKATKMLFLWTT